MPRTLHIVEGAGTSWAMFVVLSRCRLAGDCVVIIGGAHDAAAAAAVGLGVDRVVTPALGAAVLAWAELRRAALRCGDFQFVHAWSAGALAAACAAMPAVPKRVSISMPPRARAFSPVAAAEDWLVGRGVRACQGVAFSCAAVRDAWASRMGTVAVEAGLMSAERGAGDAASAGSSRDELRSAWGVEAGERVLLALADHPSLIDARRFIFHCGVMAVAGHRVVAVVPSRAEQLERAVRFTRRHHGAWRIVIDDTPLPLLLKGADVAMPASPFCAWSMAAARLAGVSVVSAAEVEAGRLSANSGLLRVLGDGTGIPHPN